MSQRNPDRTELPGAAPALCPRRREPCEGSLAGLTLALSLLLALALVAAPAAAQLVPGDCPPNDLVVTLNTGWDQSVSGTTIPTGGNDDDWDVIVDAAGGTVPFDAKVINSHPAWLTLPNSRWIASSATGPNGLYTYEMCWCMDDDALNHQLNLQFRADDQADVFLNGALIHSSPDGTFNDGTPQSVSVSDPAAFVTGENCIQVDVRNKYGVVTGLNLVGTVTADDALCCNCDAADSIEELSTGLDDATNTLIAPPADDDEWTVTVDPSGGTVPRPAGVVTPHAGWNTIPGTRWIAADKFGPNGNYVYENCWCVNEAFEQPELSVELLADDQADVYLNGALIGSTGAPGFIFPSTLINVGQPSLFRAGENCLEIHVQNTSSVVTGLNVKASFTAINGECCDCVPLPPDAEGWWPLDESVGPIADEVVNSYIGVHSEVAGSVPPPTPAPGKVNGSLSFDGVDDYVRVANTPGLNFGAGQDYSIDAWVRTNSLDRQPIVWKKATGIQPGYSFYTNAGALGMDISDGANFVFCNTAPLVSDGQWHFVAVTVDRDNPAGIRLYVDGAIEAVCDPTPVTGSLFNTNDVWFGADIATPPTQAYWRGRIDEIEIFRRALTFDETIGIYGAGGSGKCPLGNCEDSSDYPTCGGSCDTPGFVCQHDPFVSNQCTCEPEQPTCGGSYPQCNGPCPLANQQCSMDATGIECLCVDVPPPTCSNSPYPECGGECPQGESCEPIPGTQFCDCVQPTSCEQSEYPTCGGDCPAGEICSVGPAQDCYCEPAPVCGSSQYPECNGECPTGETCTEVPGAADCYCEPDVTQCGDTFYPECGGACPADEKCVNILGTDNCECEPLPQDCGTAGQYPECNGLCPANSTCVENAAQGCECKPCDIVVVDDDIVIKFPSDKNQLRWSPVECALYYNTYLGTGPLRDLDGDGLADDYGACYQSDIIATDAPTAAGPPPGSTHWYLVTGENFTSESSLGENSSGQTRPNTGACP